MSANLTDVTALLKAWRGGDRQALDRLTPLVYDHLRRLARQRLTKEPAGHTLQSADLVNEAFVRLVTGASVDWQDRVHFFAVAARVMRRILVDAARARAATKRGGDLPGVEHNALVDLDDVVDGESIRGAELCALDDALEALGRFDERRARVIELRFFGGLTVEETATLLGVSPQTVMRDWRLARAWLARELTRVGP